MADKIDVDFGSEIRVKRTEDGWSVTVSHAGGGISGKIAKTYKTLDEVLADLRQSYNID